MGAARGVRCDDPRRAPRSQSLGYGLVKAGLTDRFDERARPGRRPGARRPRHGRERDHAPRPATTREVPPVDAAPPGRSGPGGPAGPDRASLGKCLRWWQEQDPRRSLFVLVRGPASVTADPPERTCPPPAQAEANSAAQQPTSALPSVLGQRQTPAQGMNRCWSTTSPSWPTSCSPWNSATPLAESGSALALLAARPGGWPRPAWAATSPPPCAGSAPCSLLCSSRPPSGGCCPACVPPPAPGRGAAGTAGRSARVRHGAHPDLSVPAGPSAIRRSGAACGRSPTCLTGVRHPPSDPATPPVPGPGGVMPARPGEVRRSGRRSARRWSGRRRR